ncbi:MAG: BA14K family protein, partial [Agrobacterium sp.]|nr:BA14K family protein [Agrobacterium sp.]
MRNYMKNILAVGLSAIVVAGAIVPAEAAMPLPMAPKSVEATGSDAGNIVNVQYWRDRGGRGDWGDRRGWYGGHRGYRDYR